MFSLTRLYRYIFDICEMHAFVSLVGWQKLVKDFFEFVFLSSYCDEVVAAALGKVQT